LIRDRADVGFAASALECARLFAAPKYPLRKLGELCVLVQYGCSALSSTEPKGWPIIRMNNLQQEGWDFSDLKYYQPSPEEAASYRVERGDILFNRTNGSRDLVGKCEVFDEPGDWLFASYLIRIRVNRSTARPQFISQFLNTRAGRAVILRSSRQILMSNINSREIRALEIPLPSLRIQEELEAKLAMAKAEWERKLAEAEALLTSLNGWLLEQLGLTIPPADPRRVFAVRLRDVRPRLDVDFQSPKFRYLRAAIEKSVHHVVTVGSLCEKITAGFAAGPQDQAFDDASGIPHLRPLNLNTHGQISFEGTKYVPTGVVKPSDFLQPNEVLFNNTNSTELVGKTAVFTGQRPCACSNHMTRLTLRAGINPHFITALFNAFRGIRLFGLLSTNFNNQAGINTETLSTLRLPLPDIPTQNDIAAEVVRRRETAHRLQAEAATEWAAAKAWFAEQLLGRSEEGKRNS